jgi:AcrR family transcriptional regulator
MVGAFMRNVELTKQRILEAATAEFSEHGFHGARVDRIAGNANANKALIYSYFGNKEALFAAVYQEIMRQVIQDIPMDGNDLPGYLARRLEWQFHNPAMSRIFLWGRLELYEFPQISDASAIRSRKFAAIAQAQASGRIGDRFSPEEVLDLIDSLANPARSLGGTSDAEREAFERYRRTAVLALENLLSSE